jgi:CheY-like chemotaxis protein
LLTDMVMPEMGGVALSRALREKGGAGPVVVLTGYPLHEVNEAEDDLESAGVAKWLRKPVDIDQLSQVLAQTLGS